MNKLFHYGVIGMKWGVRRYQNKDGSLTRLGKRLVSEQNAREKTLDLVKNGGTIDTHTSLYRLETSIFQKTPIKDETYVSLVPSENSRYIDDLDARTGLGRASYKLNATKPLKIPSLRQTSDIFIELMSDKNYMKKHDLTEKNIEILKRNTKIDADMIEYLKDTTLLLARKDIDSEGRNIANILPKILKQKGYDAIIDVNSSEYGASFKDIKGDLLVFGKDKLQVKGKEALDRLFIDMGHKELRELPKAMKQARDFLKGRGFNID